jgi:hypothetical protein
MKKHQHRIFPILLLVLIGVVFTIGTFRTFVTAKAGANPTATPTKNIQATSLVKMTATPIQAVRSPARSEADSAPGLVSADTTGIIALASVLVVIILAGMAWAGRKPPAKKPSGK